MRQFLFAILCALVVPTYGYAWTIEKIETVSGFPGSLTITVDPRANLHDRVDILFVVDNSGSMTTHQINLAANIDRLLAPLRTRQVHVHAGVITADMDFRGQKAAGHLVNGFVTSNTADMAQTLAATIRSVGTNGSGTERHFDAVLAALTEPVLSTDNAGFLRPEAALAVVFVTDAEDQSHNTDAAGLLSFLKNLKGAGDRLRTGGLLVPSSADDKVCPRDDYTAKPVRIEEFMGSLKGMTIGLCDADLGEKVGALGLDIIPQPTGSAIREILLPLEPSLSSVKVTYGTQTLTPGDASEGWIFTKPSRILTIGPDFNFNSQAWETKLLINYVPKDWL